ncbi:hypothetical protein ACRAVF_27230 [Bradyrhizobium oligotrophicum S58]
MSIKGKPSQPAAGVLKGTTTAPFIYFDDVPMLGTFGGTIEVELSARVLSPRGDGSVSAEAVCVAHLRLPPRAAQSLIDALTKALAFSRKDREPEPKGQLDS